MEKRLREGRGGELARKCFEEMRKKCKEGKTEQGWKEERKKFF